MSIPLDHVPAMAPPPGQKSNFVDPENRNEVMIIVITISMALFLIFVGLRIYARLRSSGRLVWDDCISQHFHS